MLCRGVRGQDLARGFFARALASERISHAYLFVGPEGVGKRRFAEELAAAILCREAGAGACGECVSCRMLASRNHPAFWELEASEGKLIEIGSVREAAEALSIRGERRRIVLVDDADRLTLPATNALLKTLEEPGSGIVFLLLTSRPAHLLDTIHSRCHRVPFTALDEMQFNQVLREQGRDPTAYPDLHRAASGSPGRALRFLTCLEEAGGPQVFEALLEGQGAAHPETLVDYVPARGKEPQRARVERLIDLVLQATWSKRGEDADARLALAEWSIEIAELARSLEANQNSELILEDLGRLLRNRH